ncbi:hypothetical protein [Anoxybacillus sp. J5B_2022]|uniref:hypothetical protein n=1 Tax=Anoxybacillus sp. J5B_2022 TaxID=3003246 RepID=UPI0022859A59|nr:hypothetical protein [Anoxybacillus sp. J5B_2022]MCZ0753973.1 hypothetical protein [Anoxybacillus sp. J5B_2022]
MGERKKQTPKRLVEQLRKHGVHAELTKPRAKWSVYRPFVPKACPSAHEICPM